MFWSNWHSSQPGIQRAFFSGYSAQYIIKTDISTPNGLTIDHKEQFLYWIDARLDKIERSDFHGNHRAVCVKYITNIKNTFKVTSNISSKIVGWKNNFSTA